jgi:hypothetical protein
MADEKAAAPRSPLLPRPPPITNLTDFVVVIFAVTVVTIFVALTFGAIALALFTSKDVSGFVAIITDTASTITAALVGYIAGRGATRDGGTQ